MTELVKGNDAPYGMKAIRQIRRKGKNGTNPTGRLTKKISDTYEYFLERVDPLIGSCITHLLCEQPVDVPNAMIEYFTFLMNPETAKIAHSEKASNQKPKKEMKLYLATSIGPVVSKLVNRVAIVQPENILQFMCDELRNINTETSLLDDLNKEKEVVEKEKAVLEKEKIAEVKQTKELVEQKSVNQVIETKVTVIESIEPKDIQIAIIGVGSSGKTKLCNAMQGDYSSKTKATIGFRPVSMMLRNEAKIKFYDLGGGKKIRDIWNQYYHDIHGIIYVIDASANDEERQDCLKSFKNAMSNKLVQGKPALIFVNKVGTEGAKTAKELFKLYEMEGLRADTIVRECSCVLPEGQEEESYEGDQRIEKGLEKLFNQILSEYPVINSRVEVDTKEKAKEEMLKRLQRERKVLKNKIATAFYDSIDPSILATITADPDPGSLFDEGEGLVFLAAEIGEESEQLSELARKTAKGVGYQRLALQMVGALKAPISKKKVPMEWEEIFQLVCDLRKELGLEDL